jgi:hypothetical protein
MDARWFIFRPKKNYLGKFWRVSQWKMLVYFMDIWSIFRPVDVLILWPFVVIWYIFPRFGILYQEKSGNPDLYFLISILQTPCNASFGHDTSISEWPIWFEDAKMDQKRLLSNYTYVCTLERFSSIIRKKTVFDCSSKMGSAECNYLHT